MMKISLFFAVLLFIWTIKNIFSWIKKEPLTPLEKKAKQRRVDPVWKDFGSLQ